MKKMLALMLSGVVLMLCCSCGEKVTDSPESYPFTATLEKYPDVRISAKSLEALNEVVAALEPSTTSSTITTTTETVTTTTTTAPTTGATESTTAPTTQTTASSTTASTTAPTTLPTSGVSSAALNDTEQAIFDLLVDTLYRFTNPATVKIVKFYAYQEAGNRYFLSLTSMTDKGGYETKLYSIDDSGSCESIFSEFQIKNQATVLGLTTPTCDIAAINRALDAYYIAQGWK